MHREHNGLYSTHQFESDEWHVSHAKTLDEEDKLIEAGFEFVRYSETEQVALYRKRK